MSPTPLIIQLDWQWALGIIGLLILLAWYAGIRFSRLETSMEWVKEILKELRIGSDNTADEAFGSASPVNLKPTGEQWLVESGLKEYIDARREEFLAQCADKKESNPYEVQKHIFKLFDEIEFEKSFDDRLKQFAFEKGTIMPIMRRVGAIYLRNLCLDEFGMKREDIDKNDPDVQVKESD